MEDRVAGCLDAVDEPRRVEQEALAPLALIGARRGDLEDAGLDRAALGGPLDRRIVGVVAFAGELDVKRERRRRLGQSREEIRPQVVGAARLRLLRCDRAGAECRLPPVPAEARRSVGRDEPEGVNGEIRGPEEAL